MSTKAELAAQVAQLLAERAALMPVTADVGKPAFTIAESEAATALIDATAEATDDVKHGRTLVEAVLNFAKSIPQYAGKSVPEPEVERMTDRLEAKYRASYSAGTDFSAKSKAANSIKSRKTRAKSLYLCAAILPEVPQIQDMKLADVYKLATAVKANEFSLPKALAAQALKAAKDAEVDAAADARKLVAALLALPAQGGVDCVTAKAKAQLVAWCDTHMLKEVKGAETHRNPALV